MPTNDFENGILDDSRPMQHDDEFIPRVERDDLACPICGRDDCFNSCYEKLSFEEELARKQLEFMFDIPLKKMLPNA